MFSFDFVVDNTVYTLTCDCKSISELDSFNGNVTIKKKPVSKRIQVIQKELSAPPVKQHIRITLSQRLVVRAWNLSEYVRAQELSEKRENRNFPIPISKIASHLPLVQKAINKVGVTFLQESMNNYFIACSSGRHISKGQNFGFKDLSGFLAKVIESNKNKRSCWWDVQTPTDIVPVMSSLAKCLATSFGKTFLKEDAHKPLPAFVPQFESAAEKINGFVAEMKGRGIVVTQREVIRQLLECLLYYCANKGNIVYPSQLASDNTWQILMPQYLKEKGTL